MRRGPVPKCRASCRSGSAAPIAARVAVALLLQGGLALLPLAAIAAQARHVAAEIAERCFLAARGFLDLRRGRERPLRAAVQRAMRGVQLPDHRVDALHRALDLLAAARLLLRRALHLLSDGAHLLAALHDEL